VTVSPSGLTHWVYAEVPASRGGCQFDFISDVTQVCSFVRRFRGTSNLAYADPPVCFYFHWFQFAEVLEPGTPDAVS